ncbi:MAG: hypothetical protein RR073_05635 [Clostridia bacterium]
MTLVKQLLEYAPILGPSLTFLLLCFTIASYFFKHWYQGRLEAIKRADSKDLPSIIGDEIDKLGLKAEGLSKKENFELVKTALNQRESRSKRSFYALLLISLLVCIVMIIAIVKPPKDSKSPQEKWPSAFEEIRSAELLVSDVDDELLISVNDHQLETVKFNQNSPPIPITSLLHRGSNKLTFVVLNGKYGGCGAQVDLYLNGVKNPEFEWKWSEDIDKACANCNCFTSNKTLYLK